MDHSIEDIEEEEHQFAKVISTFKNYAQYTLSANNRRRKDAFSIPKDDQGLLEKLGYKQKLDEVDRAIIVNADFLAQIVDDLNIFEHELDDDEDSPRSKTEQLDSHTHSHSSNRSSHSHSHSHTHSHSDPGVHRYNATPGQSKKYKPTEADMDKLRSTLKQLVRDWSEEGNAERELCYKPMKEALLAHFPDTAVEARRKVKVLVPGSGLARLSFDIAQLGYTCQGNEFSHYMLITSHFILNRTTEVKKHKFYPYAHTFSNSLNKDSILQAISIPDVCPSDLPPGSNYSLAAGDFEEVYSNSDQAGKWNAVLTCFFIDTAKNIVNYLRIIHRILAPGGVWINMGPLLWHWENNNTNDPSIELDLEELRNLIRAIGFEISNERTIATTYTNNARSMLGYVYNTAFFTAMKKN